jgi:hypothetical protein
VRPFDHNAGHSTDLQPSRIELIQEDRPSSNNRRQTLRQPATKLPKTTALTIKILFLHGWSSVPGGRKPTSLKDAGHIRQTRG